MDLFLNLVCVGAGLVAGLGFSKVWAWRRAQEELFDLRKELNRITWIGADEGWNKAIEAVREEIAKRLRMRELQEKEIK